MLFKIKLRKIKWEGKMFKKCVISFVVLAFLNFVGCYSSEIISKREIRDASKQIDFTQGITITTSDYSRYHFAPNQYHIENDTLYGGGSATNTGNEVLSKGKVAKIAMDDIISFEQSTIDAGKTIGLILGVIGLGLVLVVTIGAVAIGDALNPD